MTKEEWRRFPKRRGMKVYTANPCEMLYTEEQAAPYMKK